MTMPGYLTEDELCARLGIHPRTLYRWRMLGEGPPRTVMPGGRQSIYNEASFLKWLRSREQVAA